MLTNNAIRSFLRQIGGLNQGTSCYIGLSSTQPDIIGQGITEPIGNGYERALFNSISSNNNTNGCATITEEGVLTNSSIIYFGEALGSWGTLNHYCLFSSKTGGTLLAYGDLETPITPTVGTVPLIREGAIQITISRGE